MAKIVTNTLKNQYVNNTGMKMIKKFMMRLVAYVTSGSLLLSGGLGVVNAEMVGTQTALSAAQPVPLTGAIGDLLTREQVRKQLIAFGVDPVDAEQRIAALTREELETLHRHIENMPAGAGLLEVIGIVFVVLLILELLGVTNIFTRV